MNERQQQSSSSGHHPQHSFENLREQQFRSPHEILAASGSMESVRIRNVQNMLKDFFGL